MTVPHFYLVAGTDAFILDEDGITVFGAPVNSDGTVDWESSYDFDQDEDDIEYIAHMSKLLIDSVKLYRENNLEVFVK